MQYKDATLELEHRPNSGRDKVKSDLFTKQCLALRQLLLLPL